MQLQGDKSRYNRDSYNSNGNLMEIFLFAFDYDIGNNLYCKF